MRVDGGRREVVPRLAREALPRPPRRRLRARDRDLRTWDQLGLKGEFAGREIETFGYSAPGFATTHVYRSPFARSSDIVHLRAERIVLAGDHQPASVHAIANAINGQLVRRLGQPHLLQAGQRGEDEPDLPEDLGAVRSALLGRLRAETATS